MLIQECISGNGGIFKNRSLSREEILQIVQYKHLLGLDFEDCAITDNDVLELCQLGNLVNIGLTNTAITDRSLEYFSRLPQLELLRINGANITGEGFRHFADHKKLKCIWAINTKLNDETLKLVAQIPKLGILRMMNVPVSFPGLMAITGNPKLRVSATNLFTTEQLEQFEQAQRDQANQTATVNDTDIASAKQILFAFFEAMTEWEKKGMSGFSIVAKTSFTNEIAERFYTKKQQIRYSQGRGNCSAAPYYTYGRHQLIDAAQVSKSRIYIFTKNHIAEQYRFTFLKKDSEWRIDELQWLNAGWKRTQL